MIAGGLQELAREIVARAEKELYDEAKVHHEMTRAYADLEAGIISEQEFDRREEDLLDRLEVIAARRRGDLGDVDLSEMADEDTEVDDDDDEDEIHYGVFDDQDDEDEVGEQAPEYSFWMAR